MKSILRSVFLNLFSLFLIAKLTLSISYQDNFMVLVWAALCFTFFNLLIKPILNILLMPINFLTMGAFRWIINVVVLYLVTVFVSGFEINLFTFPGFSSSGLVVPRFEISFFWSLILVSFLLEILFGMLNWLFR